MKKKDKTTGPNKILKAITAQSIKGHAFALPSDPGGGTVSVTDLAAGPVSLQEQPYREIDGVGVFHCSLNQLPFEPQAFSSAKLHLWGHLHHPYVVIASYSIGGDIRFYIDTRRKGFYALWTATRVDDVLEFGSGAAYDLVAWTPKALGDTVKTAGFRLVHACLLQMLFVKPPAWHCEATATLEFEGSADVASIIGAIAPTVHSSKKHLESRLAEMPRYLRSLYLAGASVGRKERLYFACGC